MAWRKHPEISAFEEGQQEGGQTIEDILAGHYSREYGSAQEAIEGYGRGAHARLQNTSDSEQREQLQGYLSKFD